MPPATCGRAAPYCSALGLALPAAAQEPSAAPAAGTFLGRILFSFGTPQSVTAVEPADTDRFQPATVADVLAGVPGIAMAGSNTAPGQPLTSAASA